MSVRTTQWTKRIAISCASVLVTVAALELSLRLIGSVKTHRAWWTASVRIHRPSRDPSLIYELVPGSSCAREGVAIAINSAGFRDDEFAHTPPDSLRIVLLGDSVAWGWSVPMASAFPQVLEAELHQLGTEPYASSIVYNLSVDGYSTEQEIRLLETRGLALHPDLVILSYVLNDPDEADGGLARYYGSRIELVQLAQRALAEFRRRFNGYPDEYHHRTHAEHRVRTIDQFRRLGEISRDRHVPILVAVTPVFRFDPKEPYPWQDLHDFIADLCAANGLSLLDLRAGFEGRDLAEYAVDALHPTAQGHAVIARSILDFLRDFAPRR